MNKQALSELSGKCHECIESWKVENWRKPLDIELGDFIEHCRMYGGDEIQNLYDEVWEGADENDFEVQKALWSLERHLFMVNLDDELAEPEDRLSEEQKECIYTGKRIAMIRTEKGMTQQQLAEKIGESREHIARIEAGKYSVGLKHLVKVAKALDMELDFVTKPQ